MTNRTLNINAGYCLPDEDVQQLRDWLEYWKEDESMDVERQLVEKAIRHQKSLRTGAKSPIHTSSWTTYPPPDNRPYVYLADGIELHPEDEE